MYESWFGLLDPPRDFSVYDMSWASTAGSVVSTTDDLTRFYRALLGGKLVGKASLDEMTRTVPVSGVDYGLGIHSLELRGCGRFWGHDGAVFGAGTIALSSRDGKRQVALAQNLMKYQELDENGRPKLHPIDDAIAAHVVRALCPDTPASGIDHSRLTKNLRFDQLSH